MRKSLRIKVVIVFVIIELLTVIAIGLLYSYRGMKLLEEEFLEKGQTLAKFFASQVTLPLLSGNKSHMMEHCEMLLARPDLVYAEIINDEKKVVIRCGILDEKDKENYQIVSYPINIKKESPMDSEGIYSIEASAPTETIGIVRLTLSRTRIEEKIKNLQQFVFWICFTALLVSTVIGLIIVDFLVVNPILRLKRGVKKFSSGDFNEKINIKTKDELQELAESFNQMADSLKKYISEQIDQATDKVQLKNLAVLGELSAMLLHEVGNTLNKFGIIKHQLAKENLSQEGLKTLDTFDENLTSLRRFTQNVSLFSKKPVVSLSKIDLKRLVQTICSSLKLIDKKGVKIDTEFPEEKVLILGDKELIAQALLNILTNAFDAVKTGGRIKVKINPSDDEVKIYISDNGKGIKPNDLHKIFQPFFTKKGPKGTGLGLAIAKSFIEAHHGNISVKSKPGETVFKIIIPTHLP